MIGIPNSKPRVLRHAGRGAPLHRPAFDPRADAVPECHGPVERAPSCLQLRLLAECVPPRPACQPLHRRAVQDGHGHAKDRVQRPRDLLREHTRHPEPVRDPAVQLGRRDGGARQVPGCLSLARYQCASVSGVSSRPPFSSLPFQYR